MALRIHTLTLCPYTQCYEYQKRIYDEENPSEDDRPFWLVCVLRFICQLERLDAVSYTHLTLPTTPYV